MLEVGMYVRCPMDEQPNNARTFYLGQITNIDEEKGFATVYFHDPKNLRAFFSELQDTLSFPMNWLVRVPALDESDVCYNGSNAKILSVSKPGDKENFYFYFVEVTVNGKKQVKEICENEIEIPFTRANYNPASQMMRYELQNPQWFLSRMTVSKSLYSIANAPFGFKNLLGDRKSVV